MDTMWRAFSDLVHNKTPAVNDENISSACFFDGNAVIRSVGAPARRSRALSWPSAIPVAFVADVIGP